MCCSSSPNGGRCIAINLRSTVERVLRPLQPASLIEYVCTISGSKRAHNVANGNAHRACNLYRVEYIAHGWVPLQYDPAVRFIERLSRPLEGLLAPLPHAGRQDVANMGDHEQVYYLLYDGVGGVLRYFFEGDGPHTVDRPRHVKDNFHREPDGLCVCVGRSVPLVLEYELAGVHKGLSANKRHCCYLLLLHSIISYVTLQP